MFKSMLSFGVAVFAIAMLGASPAPVEAQSRSYCQNRIQAMPKVQRHCAGLDTSVTLDGNPYLYKSPESDCDLGLSLPGLPNFNGIKFGIDSCKILRAVTGELVREINGDLQRIVDSSLGEVADEFNDIVIDPESQIINQIQ